MAAQAALSPVFGALQQRDLPALQALLAGPEGRQAAQEAMQEGITPLHAAALLGVADAVPLLLQAGAAVDAPRQGSTSSWSARKPMAQLLGDTANQAGWDSDPGEQLPETRAYLSRSMLRQDATPLEWACEMGRPDAAAALLAGGASVTLAAVNGAIVAGSHQLLEALLQRGHPEVPRFQMEFNGQRSEDVPVWLSYEGWWQYYDILGDCCPFYVLFRTAGAPKPSSLRRHPNLGATLPHQQPGIDAQALRCCEVLLAAGYRPTVYAEVELEERMPDGEFSDRTSFENFNILTDWHRAGNPDMAAAPRLGTPTGRLMMLLVEGKAWSPAVHKLFPPRFKAAARTLLLAHHRGAGRSQQAGGRKAKKGAQVPQKPTLLSLAPREFVLQAIALAAFPASAWVPLKPDGSQAWLHPPAAAAEPAGPEAEPEAAAQA